MASRSVLIAFLTIWGFLYCIYGVPIPKRPPGFVYREDEVSALAPVQMEVYLDLMCWDSKQAFPVYVDVAEMYGPEKLRLSSVMFPLPYHPHAYWASMVAFYLNRHKPESTYDFMQAVFDKYEVIGPKATLNATSHQVVKMLGDIAYDFGVSVDSSALLDFDAETLDKSLAEARVEWKYSCTRGAFGTPNVFLNGVFVTNNQSWTVNDWKTILDPMIYKV